MNRLPFLRPQPHLALCRPQRPHTVFPPETVIKSEVALDIKTTFRPDGSGCQKIRQPDRENAQEMLDITEKTHDEPCFIISTFFVPGPPMTSLLDVACAEFTGNEDFAAAGFTCW